MAEQTIRTEPTGIAIELTGIAGRSDALLEAFSECQEGRCTCPTDEYQKVASMEVEVDADRIAIRLTAKPDTRFDAAEIEACLDHMTAENQEGRTEG